MPILLSTLCTELTKHSLVDYPAMRSSIVDHDFFQNIIIVDALISYDMVYQTKTAREIEKDISEGYYLIKSESKEYDSMRKLIIQICNHNGLYQYDTGFDPEKMEDFLLNSIGEFKKRFNDIASKKSYLDLRYPLEKSMSLADKHEEVIHYLRDKIQISKRAGKIFDLLKETGNNFILKNSDDEYYYPVITDLLFDTFHMDYYFGRDADFIQGLCATISPLKAYQHTSKQRLPRMLYSKAIFIEKIKKSNARTYIWKEYSRTLSCDEKLFRKLYIEILYFNREDGKSFLKSKLDISKIYSRCYLLNRSKIVLPMTTAINTLKSMQEFNIYRKLEEKGKI